MTTLPQTTPIRLPRPASPSPLSVPANTAVVAGGTGVALSGADIWRVIRANLWLIILCVMVAGVAGFYVNRYLEQHYSKWTATGSIQVLGTRTVDPNRPDRILTDNNNLVVDQKTAAVLLKQDALINQVMQDPESPIRTLSWWTVTCGADPQKAHELLAKNLSVSPILETRLISVSMTTDQRGDAPLILKTIVDAFLAQQGVNKRDATNTNMQMLKNQQTSLGLEEQHEKEMLNSLSAELNLHGISTNGSITSGKAQEQYEKTHDLMQAQQVATYSKTALDAFMAQLNQGEMPPQVAQAVDSDPTVSSYRTTIEQLDLELADLSNKFGTSNPSMLSLQKRRDLYQRRLDDAKAEKAGHVKLAMQTALESQKDSAQKALDAVTADVNQLNKELGEYSSKLAQYQSIKEEAQNTHDTLNQIRYQLTEMNNIANGPEIAGLQWNGLPQKPDSPSFPQLTLSMSVAIAAGLALSLGIAFLREITDTTVRSPRDIQRVGQMSLLGMVPHEADDPQSAGARLPLVIFEAPHSIMAEQFRQVRTRLQHTASLDTTRTILVTSPSPGDGKSTIAVNLAAGLALNGRRILLVDVNFRRPELHRIFGIGNEQGFSDALNDVNNFDSVVQETQVPNLSVIPSGPRPSNPTELLESQLLLDFVDRALEEYDHVVFDTGPMLFVSDTMALAPRVDGVVTVVRARTSSRGVLQRMRDGLRAVKAEHLGIVLNGVRSQGGGYYGRNIKTYYEYQSVQS